MKNRWNPFNVAVTMVLASIVLAACAPVSAEQPVPEQPVAPPAVPGPVTVDSIEILVMESFPVQVSVHVRGYLPDPCTVIDLIVQERVDDRFEVELVTTRDPDEICIQVLEPFEVNVSLDVDGLPAGTYTVDVHGVTGTFTLDIDNVLDS